MTVGFVAFHYPTPEHFEEFVGRTHQVADFLQSKPGCLSAECWATTDGGAVVTTGRFESQDTFQAAFAAAVELGPVVGFDEREHRPREVYTLLSR
ncbi:antibiotic biosynthesis monooxygenase [Nonomuraea sp. NPDC050536]|uniref:antibiotic biosynthesis monooxygenase n=1 Tax=Nonomuraea sp. NPDC050536 TaxID=3364366 RepID=UPI0037CB7163